MYIFIYLLPSAEMVLSYSNFKATLTEFSATRDKSRDGLMRHWSRDLHEMSQPTKIGDRVGLGFEYAN